MKSEINQNLIKKYELKENSEIEAKVSLRRKIMELFDSAGFEIENIYTHIEHSRLRSEPHKPCRLLVVKIESLPYPPGGEPKGWPI